MENKLIKNIANSYLILDKYITETLRKNGLDKLTFHDIVVLVLVKNNKPCTVDTIMKNIEFTKDQTVKILEHLFSLNYISVLEGEIRFTDFGKEFLPKIDELVCDFNVHVYTLVSESDRHNINKFLEKFQNDLHKND